MWEEKCKQQVRQSNTEYDIKQLILQGRHLPPILLCLEAADVATKFWETLLTWKLLDSNLYCLKAPLLDATLLVWCYNRGSEELYCAWISFYIITLYKFACANTEIKVLHTIIWIHCFFVFQTYLHSLSVWLYHTNLFWIGHFQLLGQTCTFDIYQKNKCIYFLNFGIYLLDKEHFLDVYDLNFKWG